MYKKRYRKLARERQLIDHAEIGLASKMKRNTHRCGNMSTITLSVEAP